MISDVQALADLEGLHGSAGSVASTLTIWRVLAVIDQAMLAQIRQARAESRDRAWTARGELTGSELPGSRAAGETINEVVIDLDATLVTALSDKDTPAGISRAASVIICSRRGWTTATRRWRWSCDRGTPEATPLRIT